MKIAAFVFLYAIALYQVYWRGWKQGARFAMRWVRREGENNNV